MNFWFLGILISEKISMEESAKCGIINKAHISIGFHFIIFKRLPLQEPLGSKRNRIQFKLSERAPSIKRYWLMISIYLKLQN